MEYITRGQWYRSIVENFLENETASHVTIDLFTSEARRLEKQYPVEVSVGPILSKTDLRHNCIVTRK